VAYVPERFDDGPRTVAAARAFGLEGAVAKQAGSTYQPGRRSPAWVKHPFAHTAEIVIIGHRPGQGRRAGTIGSLLVALPGSDGTLRFAGGVGTGFRYVDLRHLQQFLAPLHRDTPSVSDIAREHARGATWVEPAIVAEVAYRTITPDGMLRHPGWRGLRPDKQPHQVLAPCHPLPRPHRWRQW
jgi:bifunctional non-homologous end joining protein LigD